MLINNIDNIVDILNKSNKIGITFHVSPDGDSLGSSLALMQGLSKLGKNSYIISKENLPNTFSYLPYSDTIDEKVCVPLEGTDCVVVLDCGNVDRINANLDLEGRKYTLINIDHHLSNDLYGDLNYVDNKAAAVAEIIYKILKKLNVVIDKPISSCIYTSLITDTGSFKYSNTTKSTHSIAGELIDIGIDFPKIHRDIFENAKFSRVKLQGKVIENMYLDLEEKVCVMELTKDMLRQFNLEDGDTSDIINIGTQIGSVEVTILLKESDEKIKVSLRSKNEVDVRKVAEKFGGGGHIRAAGFACANDITIKELKKILIQEIEKELI